MNVVYILGTGSKWDDNELRYSLRSLQKFGSNIGDVYIVGYMPSWVKNCIHIPCEDPCKNKYDNAWHKMRYISNYAVGKMSFVLMNDDFYLLEKIDFSKPLYFVDGTITALIRKFDFRYSTYIDCQRKTLKFLQTINRRTLNFATHAPITIGLSAFKNWFDLLGHEPGISFRNFYANQYAPFIDIRELPDCKLKNAEGINSITTGQPFFSIADSFLEDGKDYFNTLYPEKSIYEV